MPVYLVSQVTSYVKETLERESLLQDIWISGEVANLARPASGHSYFSLRDADSTLRCVMFRNAGSAELLDNGSAVIAHGRISIYEPRGDLQVIVDLVQPEGVGELQLKLELLKQKLEAEGLFEPSRKRPLPAFPERIGVITSPSGAVWHDIQKVIGRRYPLVELVLAPAAVQGESAVPSIVDAFQVLNEAPDVDMVVLARGGGSLEDLWAFNEEAVARAIYSSRAPVISGVGHETDVTIADLVADQRASTPSAAAEMAVPDKGELASSILMAARSLVFGVKDGVSEKSETLGQLGLRLHRSRPNLDTVRMRIDDLLAKGAVHLRHAMRFQRERLDGLEGRLSALSPMSTLRRGYAIVQTGDDHTVVSDTAQVGPGDTVDVTLSKGGFAAEVTSTRPEGDGRVKRKESPRI